MINKDFYPTPTTLITKLFSGLQDCETFLEPSAGKGDICDYITYKNTKRGIYVDCIEIEKDLQIILKGKGYSVIYDNFLSFNSGKQYDAIIANFPFSDGDKHLFKAIELQKRNGGYLHCIVNAETIKNPFSNFRKEVLNQLNGAESLEIEYLENAFADAERKTGVEIAIIKAKFKQDQTQSILLDNLKKSYNVFEKENENKEVVNSNPVIQLIERYNLEQKVGVSLINEYNALIPFIKESMQDAYNKPILSLTIGTGSYSNATINDFLKQLRVKYWRLFLGNDNVRATYNSKIVNELQNKLVELQEYDFNEFNINALKEELDTKIVFSIEENILSLFDELSYQYSYNKDYGDNVHLFNGWKTNKAWKINEKVIVPFYALDSRWGETKIDRYRVGNKLNDIIKVLNYLDNKVSNVSETVDKKIDEANKNGNYKNIDLGHIIVTFYKKGTAHIVFKDKMLLDKFNIFGCQKKGWLPPSYGKKTYKDMSEEEKETVNTFQGEKEYEKILINSDFYLVDTNKFLLN